VVTGITVYNPVVPVTRYKMKYDFNEPPVGSVHVRQAWMACPLHPFLKLVGLAADDIVEEVEGV